MNESHKSCDELFDCSCPELNTLTKICRESGALGSRLTGAGWGGAIISLVDHKNLKHFVESVKKNFYEKVLHMKEDAINANIVFSTVPAQGALILKKKLK